MTRPPHFRCFVTALASAAILTAARAATPDPSLEVMAQRGAVLAPDSCGTLLGAKPDVTIDRTAKLAPGLALGDRLPLSQLDADQRGRDALAHALSLAPDDELRIASFSALASVREFPFVVVGPANDPCYIMTPSGDPAILKRLEDRLAAPASPWHDRDDSDGGVSWRRPAPCNERVLLTYASHAEFTAIVVALEDLATQVRGVIGPCVEGVIAARPDAWQVEVKARGDQPAHQAWRVTRRGMQRKADITVSVESDDVAIVRVEYAESGWWR